MTMKRFHVHVAVEDLAQSMRFYSSLFAAAPTVVKDDYAKWMLDDPRINFAISQRGQRPGVNHLGLQAESDEELQEIHSRLQQAEGEILSEQGVHCCYARSDKHWIADPQGIAWENFRSLGDVPLYYGESTRATLPAASCGSQSAQTGCCAPGEAVEAEKSAIHAGACCSA
jgi:hypothetical protein